MADQHETPNNRPLCVVVDTNIWRSTLLLRTPLAAAFLYTLRQSKSKLGLPEVIEEEIIKNTIRAGIEAGENIDKNFRIIEMLTGSRSDYQLPTVEDFEKHARERLSELKEIIIRVPFTLNHAKAALNKVFLELPPNGPKNQQYKDSAIWEALLELAQFHNILFVSNDNGYYKDRDNKKGLANNLRDEVASTGGQFAIYNDLTSVLSQLQQNTPPLNKELLALIIEVAIRPDTEETAGKRQFELRNLTNATIEAFLTEKTAILAIDYKLRFNLVNLPVPDQERREPYVIVAGSCYYNLDDNRVYDFRKGHEEFFWIDTDNVVQQNKNMYGYAEFHIGTRTIQYSLKVPLPNKQDK